jgi:hypothetical protein
MVIIFTDKFLFKTIEIVEIKVTEIINKTYRKILILIMKTFWVDVNPHASKILIQYLKIFSQNMSLKTCL